jgi:2-oxo-4-hydroxy-4-carboxy--5-ureidoimidazoline (OHCU) decarboxylase
LDEQLQLINAHPRLGAPKEQLSQQSLNEQGYSATASPTAPATDSGDQEVNAQLQRLNEEYERKFGFKFIVFVNGRPKRQLIPVMEQRLRRDLPVIDDQLKVEELSYGLMEMVAIARDRLRKSGRINMVL